MLKSPSIILLSVLIFLSHFSNAQNILKGFEHLFTPVQKYAVYQVDSKITIDGKAEEPSWQKADWSENFVDLVSVKNQSPLYNTRYKMLWDKKYLYILIELEDPQIWTYYVNHDEFVYLDNALAVLLDPDRDTHYYYEFHINAQNTVYDQYQTMPPRNVGRARLDWQLSGLKSATTIDGTLNNPTDIDKKWTIEVAVPFRSLSVNKPYLRPVNKEFWKVNLLRVHWPTKIVDGSYYKVGENNPNWNKNMNHYYLNGDNWVWSPQGIRNILYPERWGLIRFYEIPVGSKKVDFDLPDEEVLGRYLWAVYYKQKQHNKKTLHYAKTLSEIGIPQLISTDKGVKVYLKMEIWGSSFLVTLQNKEGLKMSVNQDGEFLIIDNPTED